MTPTSDESRSRFEAHIATRLGTANKETWLRRCGLTYDLAWTDSQWRTWQAAKTEGMQAESIAEAAREWRKAAKECIDAENGHYLTRDYIDRAEHLVDALVALIDGEPK